MYKCDIKIMASPKRYAHVLNLCKVLKLDIEQDVFFDDRPNGGDAAYTSKRTWALPFADNNITHRCVLQDDVLTCKEFKNALEQLVNRFPDDIFSFFCPSSKMVNIQNKFESNQIVDVKKCGVYGPAIAIPRKYIPEIYSWGERIANGAKIIHDDVLIGEYALAHNLHIYTTVPSLVQHLEPVKSLLGYGRESKVSKVFDMESGFFDWSKASANVSITIPNSMRFYK